MLHKKSKRILVIVVVGLICLSVGAWLVVERYMPQTHKVATNSTNKKISIPPTPLVQQNILKANTLASSGNTTGAVAALDAAAASSAVNTEKSTYYTQAATLLVTDGQTTQAIASMQSAISSDPTNGQLYANLGYMYESIGDTPSAKAAFQQAVAIMKSNPTPVSSSENGGLAEAEGQLQLLGGS